jgi:hypothetical protein
VWKFFLFGVFDGLAGFLFSIGAPNTPATLQNIINQVATQPHHTHRAWLACLLAPHDQSMNSQSFVRHAADALRRSFP